MMDNNKEFSEDFNYTDEAEDYFPVNNIDIDSLSLDAMNIWTISNDYVKKNDDLRRSRMAESFLCNDSRDLWREIKRVKYRISNYAPSLDGRVSHSDIASVFF